MAILDILVKVGFDEAGLKEADKKIGKFLKSGLKVGGAVAGAAIGAVGAAATVAAAQAVDFAEQSNAAMEQFRRETGLSKESVEEFSGSAKNLFALGVGDGIDDIAESMGEVRRVMQSGAKDTEQMTRRALDLRNTFDKDVGESVDAVKVLMDEFGLSSEQAFDFLAQGLTQGLDRNGDFLDSIREYSNIFGDANADASQFFSVLESGAAGGVLGTDKVADAFKEFQIRFVEGNKDLVEGLDTLGLSYDDLRTGVESGSISIIDAFGMVTERAGEIDVSLLSNREAVAKLGTQFEDLGAAAVGGITLGSTSLEDMAGAADNVAKQNMTIAESLDMVHRQFLVAIEPAAQTLMPLLAEGVAKVSEFLTAARPIFTEFAGDLSNTLGPAIQIIGDSLSRIAAVFGVVEENASGMDAALAILKGTLDLVVTGIEAVAVATKLLADAFEIAKGINDQVGQIVTLGSEALGIPNPREIAAGVGGLLGFQHGGEFTVGGQGGPDSQLVAFKATPGERVSVSPQGGGGGITININAPVFGVNDLEAKFQTWGQSIVNQIGERLN